HARVDALRRRFSDRDAVRVVRADASDLRLPRRPFRVVANPPFAITSQLLRRLLAPGSRLTHADLVLQRNAARRWADGRAPGARLRDGGGARRPAPGVRPAAAGRRCRPRHPASLKRALPRSNTGAMAMKKSAILARVRKLCLALPEATEKLSHGSPTWFVKQTFVMYLDDHHGDGRLALWCAAAPGVQGELVDQEPDRFFVPPYVGGRGRVPGPRDPGPDL